MFPVVDVDRRRADAVEPLGTKAKFWFRDDDKRILFKAEERGTGEDWAEKVACELCDLLGLPHVHYELAFEVDQKLRGVICENIAPRPPWLAHGNQLMLDHDSAYPAEEGRKYKVREHTVDGVAAVVGTLGMPIAPWSASIPDGITSGLGVFVGYAMIDAWIANQDRHHENWAALKAADGSVSLAPTFDHGASLARNVSDEEKEERMTTKDHRRTVAHFARRARSAFYEDATETRPMTTVGAWRAFSRHAPEESRIWLDRLAAVSDASIEAVLDNVPPTRLSGISRDFTLRLLGENKTRLLDEHDE